MPQQETRKHSFIRKRKHQFSKGEITDLKTQTVCLPNLLKWNQAVIMFLVVKYKCENAYSCVFYVDNNKIKPIPLGENTRNITYAFRLFQYKIRKFEEIFEFKVFLRVWISGDYFILRKIC